MYKVNNEAFINKIKKVENYAALAVTVAIGSTSWGKISMIKLALNLSNLGVGFREFPCFHKVQHIGLTNYLPQLIPTNIHSNIFGKPLKSFFYYPKLLLQN